LEDSKGTKGNLKRNKKDVGLLHIYVVYSMKAPAKLEIRGWIRTYGPPIPFLSGDGLLDSKEGHNGVENRIVFVNFEKSNGLIPNRVIAD
jgi:hypothetical protein